MDNAFVFQQIYPDSHIAKSFQISETKPMYVMNFGLSPNLE